MNNNSINKSNNNNKLSDKIEITPKMLGRGSFGEVYIAKENGKSVAVKCEDIDKNKNKSLTLLKEFKICRKIDIIREYINYVAKNDNNRYKNEINKLAQNKSVRIFKYIESNNILKIPEELSIIGMIDFDCLPKTYSFIECESYNFLTMELCNKNLENILKTYTINDESKYFIAHTLLHSLSCIHRCGIIHRDIKLANIVLDKDLQYPMFIDMGLSKEYCKYNDKDQIEFLKQTQSKDITGTPRYVSLNIHKFNSPTIIDDLISLTYVLSVIFNDKELPWVGHIRDQVAFNEKEHTKLNCKCKYHKNIKLNDTKKNNSIAEMKFHTDHKIVAGKYPFIEKWLTYLYSLKANEFPSYSKLYNLLSNDSKKFGDDLVFTLQKKV